MVFYKYMSAHFSDPRENVQHLALREGMKVGDFGAGSGHYARAASVAVGPSGKVYAVDVQDDILKHLKLNSLEHHRRNIETVWGNVEESGGTHLQGASLDAIIVANTLFQLDKPEGLLAEIRRTIKPSGKILVVDWAGSYGGMGPAQERVVSEHMAEELFIKSGFYKMKSFRGGPHHYGIIFTAP